MAIYHCQIKIGSRSKGQNAVAASAYRSATKIYSEETGVLSNFENKKGVIYSEVSLCKNAPQAYKDRAVLWNAVHQIEKQSSARLWREIEVALPRELNRNEQIKTIQEYVSKLTDQGMCADWSLHDKGDGNPHAHIMLTVRSILDNGEWAPKAKKVYDLDENGEKIFQKIDKAGRKQYKSHKEDYNNWNEKERVEEWRNEWEKVCNAHLHDCKIDHRSYEKQGIKNLLPTIHEGYAARKMSAQGISSERVEYNKAVRNFNKAVYEHNNEARNFLDEKEKLNKLSKLLENLEVDEPAHSTPVIDDYVAELKTIEQKIYEDSYLLSKKNQLIDYDKIRKEEIIPAVSTAAEDFKSSAMSVQTLNNQLAEQKIFAIKIKAEIKSKLKPLIEKLKKSAKILESKLGIPITYGTTPLNFENPEKNRCDQIYEQAITNIEQIRTDGRTERVKIADMEKSKDITQETIKNDYMAFKSVLESVPVDMRSKVAATFEKSPKSQNYNSKIIENEILKILNSSQIVKNQDTREKELQKTKRGTIKR